MANIILDPNETFEHYHSEASYTTLLKGKATYELDSIARELIINEPILTQAFKSHVLKNIGEEECVLNCGHGVGG